MTFRKQALLLCSLMYLFAVSASAQWWRGGIAGEGPKVTKTLDIARFDGFSLAVGGKVYVRQGDQQSVKIEAQQNIIDNIKKEVRDGYWKIGFEESVRRHDGLTIWITVPTLSRVGISGSGNITGETPFRGLGNFETSISGSGDIDLDIEAGETTASISGSGNIDLSGAARSLNLRISGSGDINAGKLRTGACDVRISGSGDCTVYAEEELAVSSSGSGDVYYHGRPRVKARVSGSGKVEPKS